MSLTKGGLYLTHYLLFLYRLKVNVRLFIVMGLTWVCEIITWHYQYDNNRTWYILDSANVLQGFFIFLIFVIKEDVLKAMRQRFRDLLPSRTRQVQSRSRHSTSTIFTTMASSDTRSTSFQSRKWSIPLLWRSISLKWRRCVAHYYKIQEL